MTYRKISSSRLSRRMIFGGVGAAALAPFFPLYNASGQSTLFPKRLVLFWTPHGTVRENWLPSGTGDNFTLGPILTPLAPFKNKLVVLDGLTMDAGPGSDGPHTKGMPAMWTGSPFPGTGSMGGGSIGWGPSVDQVVATQIGKTTTYKSLEFGFQPGAVFGASRMIYAAAGQPISPTTDPSTIYGRIFRTALTPSDLDRIRAEKKSVLDLVSADLTTMRGSAPAADRPKIDAHLETIRTIENRLSGAAAACKAPAATGKISDSSQNMPKSLDAYSDLATAAMACDLTRVVTYQITKGDNDGAVYGFLGMTEGHHDISHKGDSDTQARANLTKIYTFYAERLAYLLKSLDAVPEGSGTMLDNTLVVWGSEIAKGNTHAFTPIPFVMAGGAGGAIATGRFQTFPPGTAHNRLLVTICRAFGLANTQMFGTSDKGSGPLPGVLV